MTEKRTQDWLARPAWAREPERPTWLREHIPSELRESLFVFTVTLPNAVKFQVNLAANIDIDYEMLEEELGTTPQHYIWWASIYSEARAMVAVIERAVKVRKKQVTEVVLAEAKQEGTKLTEKALLAIVDGDDTIQKLEEGLIKAQKNTGKLYYMVRALEMKSEHLRSLSGFKRQEREQQ